MGDDIETPTAGPSRPGGNGPPGEPPPVDPGGDVVAPPAGPERRPDLAAEPLAPCRSDAPRLGEAEVAALAAELPGWKVTERNGIDRLERAYPMPSYRAALDFTRRVGALAEAADHHPAILTEYGRVTVRWWTWAVRGLHRNDVVMAARTDRLYEGWSSDGA